MREIVISILTFNKLSYTKKCLETIFKNTRLKYILVVSDNGSTDGTAEYFLNKGVEEEFGNIIDNKYFQCLHFINNKRNIGFSEAHNHVMKLYKGYDILLLNNDIEVPSNWLNTLYGQMKAKELGAVSPAIKTPGGLDVGAVLDGNARGKSIINDYSPPDWITGSCFLIDSKTIDKIGYLDENYRFYYEDVDYCKTMRKTEIPFMCIREVQVIHANSVSSNPQQKKIVMEESRQYFAKKWGYQV